MNLVATLNVHFMVHAINGDIFGRTYENMQSEFVSGFSWSLQGPKLLLF